MVATASRRRTDEPQIGVGAEQHPRGQRGDAHELPALGAEVGVDAEGVVAEVKHLPAEVLDVQFAGGPGEEVVDVALARAGGGDGHEVDAVVAVESTSGGEVEPAGCVPRDVVHGDVGEAVVGGETRERVGGRLRESSARQRRERGSDERGSEK